jgi:lysophospholipase L1-like esterase
MYRKIIWNIILLISIISAIVFSVSIVISAEITTDSNVESEETKVEDITSKENQTTLNENSDSYNILVLGDSLAKGTGDEKGIGFAKEVANVWGSKTNKKIDVNNIAVDGDVSSGLLTIVHEPETIKSIESSNLIFISIGGNEVKVFQENRNDTVLTTELKTTQDNYLNNLQEITDLIASKNKNCKVGVIGLYNPFGEDISQDNLKILYDWNYKTETLLASYYNVVFVPTYDLFKYNSDKYLAPDKFHPNSDGYKAIANRILEIIKQ